MESENKREKPPSSRDSPAMGYQMLNFSYRRVMISSRVLHNASRCPGQRIIAKRIFSQTARAGDIVKGEDQEGGLKIYRVGSKRSSIVRGVVSRPHSPFAAGETVREEFIEDIKSDLQELRHTPQQKTSSSVKPEDDEPVQKCNNDHSDSSTSKVSLERTRLPNPRQFSIISLDPRRTTKEEVLQLVSKRARMSRAQYFGNYTIFSDKEAVVILVTPAFAKWLEDEENFIKPLLERLTYHCGYEKQNHITVVGAVVDGLAPVPDDIPVAERAGSIEGFSFMHGLQTQVLGSRNVWNSEAFKNSTTNPDKLSHLILTGKPRENPREVSLTTTISLPLANTLFVNGRHSTLEVSQWIRRDKGEYKCIRSAEKQYQHIKAFHYESTSIPPIFVPAVPLTLPRPIANGLGNIVRQLSFGTRDIDNRPASSELETQVTRYMEFSKLHTNIGVWALIYRQGLLDPNLKALSLKTTQHLESTWGDGNKNLRFVGTQLALGAILCRVVSGGGGWGVKKGLLSLDPQLSYEDIASAKFDYVPYWLEEGQDSTLDNLVRRGDYIQFFTIDPGKLKEYESPIQDPTLTEVSSVDSGVSHDEVAAENYITHEPEKTGLDFSEACDLIWSNKSVFGVVPSTIDKLPPSETAGESNALDEELPSLSFRQGNFGAVSQSGIFLQSAHQKRINDTIHKHIHTKIDMPYSYVYRSQRGTPPWETLEYRLRPMLEAMDIPDQQTLLTPRQIATSFSISHGRYPTRAEEAFLLLEYRRKIFAKTHGYEPFAEEAEVMRLAAERSKLALGDNSKPPIRKWRVGHTRWPNYRSEDGKNVPVCIRRIKVQHGQLRIRFSPISEDGEEKCSSI